jgi:two-component system, cell cycle sensor histidine kinase and response regulator CckA
MDGAEANERSQTVEGVETVLLAENEPAVRRLAALALRMRGYTVIEARTGGEAIQSARSHAGPIHLLITGLTLADMNGRTLAAAVAGVRPEARVIIVSGSLPDEFTQEAGPGFRPAFLHKPYIPSRLARKVREVLDQNVCSPMTAEA